MKIYNRLNIIKINFITQLKFIKSFLIFLKFIILNYNTIKKNDNNNPKNEFIILIHPWNLNTTPWFSITLGIILSQQNNKVEFLIDDLPWNNYSNFNYGLIEIALLSIKKYYKYNKISNFKQHQIKSNLSEEVIESFAFANAVHYHRGEVNTAQFFALKLKFEKFIKNNEQFILETIKVNASKTFILPGGIYQNTIIFNELLKKENIKFFTFDSGFGLILFAKDGIAAQMRDIEYSFDLLKNTDSEELDYIKLKAYEEFNLRVNGNNLLNSQYVSYNESIQIDNVGFLIPLNSPWDAAALNINTLFDSYNQWLIKTIRLIIENCNDNITIRQHPDERHWWGKTNTNFEELILNEFGENKRIIFISCIDKINTYYLLDRCKAVICYSSTIGVESIIKGKATAVCSDVYYGKLNFVYKPLNIHSLVSFIKNPNDTLINCSKDNALITYYLGQKCNWLKTNFTPMFSDFSKWVNEDLFKIYNDKSVVLLIRSIEMELPLSYIIHKYYYDEN